MKRIVALLLILIFIFALTSVATAAETSQALQTADTLPVESETETLNEPLTQGGKITVWIITSVAVLGSLCTVAVVAFKKK